MNSELPLAHLATRHSGLSAGIALAYEEAARVCLARHHAAPVQFDIRDNGNEHAASVDWRAPDVGLLKAWANEIDATEAGAYALALATMELIRGLVAVGRAESRTGSDYYVAVRGTAMGDFENALRLEVSGMSEGTLAGLEARLKRKLEQAAAGKSNLPAAAVVVGFALRTILSADLRPS